MGAFYSPSSRAYRKIDESEFFFVQEDNYDEHAELAIPGYIEMHEALPWCVPAKDQIVRVLDLGCGTGKTSKVILDSFPRCFVIGIDLFDEMLSRARRRLQPYGDRFSVIRGDVRETSFGEGRDLCVAALALHHLTVSEKRQMFEKIFQCLAPGGRFLMIDWTRFASPTIQESAAKIAEVHVSHHVADQHVVAEWVRHWREKNLPETVEDLMGWIRSAGFRGVECVMRNFGVALLVGEK